jgi:4-amino-4-deoxy-L-arabinose transferase-like glycosyltransferase
MTKERNSLVLLLVLAGVLFSINLGGYDVWPADEPRFAEVAREMLLTGDWLAPHVNGQPYTEKPPLLFWGITLASLPGGRVTPLTTRVPSVLSALLVVALTYMTARSMFGRRIAFWSALVLMTGLRFWWQARTGQIDMVLTACVTVALYHLWRWDEDRRAWRLPVIWLAVAAGLLAKGPPALVFPLLWMLVYYWGNRPARKQLHWIIGCLAAMGLVMLWFIPARMSIAGEASNALGEGVGGNLFRNTIGRLFLGVSHLEMPWYYLKNLPADLFPWSLFLPWTLWWLWKNRGASKMHWFLWCWTVPAFLFFSASLGKRQIYLLPVYPALAVIIAASVLELADSARAVWRRRTGYAWAATLALIGIVPVVVWFSPYRPAVTLPVAVFSLLTLLLAAYAFVQALKTDGRQLHAVMGAQVALVLALVPPVIFPAASPYSSAREFCAPLALLSDQGRDYTLYSLGVSREEYIFNARKFHTPLFTGLVGADKIPPDKIMEAATLQKKARKVIADAVRDVPLASQDNATPGERDALLKAIAAAVDKTGKDAAAIREIEDEVRAELDAFVARVSGPDPACWFVMENDWHWMQALQTRSPECTVIRHDGVGRRSLMLMANPAAMKLLGEARQAEPAAKNNARG